jgi:hypothetical protein
MDTFVSSLLKARRSSGVVATRHKCSLPLVALIVTVLTSACVWTDAGLVSLHCARPGHSVGSADQAILAAREIWHCAKPLLEQTDEQSWHRHFRATQNNGVWRVSELIPDGYAGGGLIIDMSAADGHLINMTITQ